MFPINFLEGIHVDFQRISEWMTFDGKGDYENLIARFKKFPGLVDEICEVLRVSLEKKMTYHSYSMVCLIFPRIGPFSLIPIFLSLFAFAYASYVSYF